MKTSVVPLLDFNEVLHTLTSALQVFPRRPVLQRASSSSKKTAHDEWSFWQHLFI